VSLWGVLTEFDNLSWTPEIQARFPEKHDPDLAFVTPRSGAREPYIDLYMYLLMQTTSRWPSVKSILSSAAELNKGRARAATQCKLLRMVQWFQVGIGARQKAVIAALSCSCLSSTMFFCKNK
jgi:hypothetical protein